MKHIISKFSFLLAVLLICSILFSCGKKDNYKSDIDLLNSEPYYMEFEMVDEEFDITYSGYIAKSNDKFSFMLDNSILLLSPNESYSINFDESTYSEHTATDIDYSFFNYLFHRLKIKDIVTEDSATTVYCKNSSKRRINFIYQNDTLNEIHLYLFSNEYPTILEIENISTTIPSEIIFDIPEGFHEID